VPGRIRIALDGDEIALHRASIRSNLIELFFVLWGKHSAIELEKHSRLVGDLVIVQIGDDAAKLCDFLVVLLGLVIGLVGPIHGVTGATIGPSGLFIGSADGLSILGDVLLSLLQVGACLVGL